MTMQRVMVAGLCGVLGWGCTGPTPHVPRGWTQHDPADHFTDADAPSRFQVLVAYGGNMPSHTMLRVVAAGGAVLWDPGGGFALADANYRRQADLIRDPGPPLRDILAHRWRSLDVAVEVFEWDVTVDEARALRSDLVGNGADEPFRTDRRAGVCSLAISEFIMRHGLARTRLSSTYGWPQDLARALYARRPDRVRLFRYGGEKKILIPPGYSDGFRFGKCEAATPMKATFRPGIVRTAYRVMQTSLWADIHVGCTFGFPRDA